MADIPDRDRAIIEPDGSHHYGLIRTTTERTFAKTFSIDLPAVDIKTLPESQNVAEWLQIEDQMQQGSCQGNARTSAEEVAIYRQTEGQVKQLSRQFAYITSQQMDGITGDRGSTMEGGARASQKFGSCLESLAPYTGKYYTQFSKEAWTNALDHTLTDFARLENYDQVLRWLVWGVGGAVNGIGWNGSCEPDGQGKIESYRSGGGGHALALVDWTKKHTDTAGRPYVQMFNSWSRRWGANGIAFIAPSVIDYWCKNETVLGYSSINLKDIKPREYDWIKQSFWS
jgi:hypothetical protein